MPQQIKIEMISTGDEVLYGQIIDTNSAWLSDFLFQEGLKITSRYTVGDNLTQLVKTFQERSLHNDIIIVNGGLGPTSDDLSAQAAANANHETLVYNQAWLKVMSDYFAKQGRPMTENNKKQAMLPASATLVDNPVGTACGFKMTINNCLLYFTPGVPFEFKEMVKTQIWPDIKSHFVIDDKPCCFRLTTLGRSESEIATLIDQYVTIPKGVDVGYRSAMPIIELKLTGSESLKASMEPIWQIIKQLVKTSTIFEGTIGIESLVSQKLKQAGLALHILEQHTAGLMAYQLYQADAPISDSQVRLKSEISVTQYIKSLDLSESELFIGLTDFSEDNRIFTLTVATNHSITSKRLKYTSRRFDPKTEQMIFAMIGHDAIRRHLEGLPLVGDNIWIEQLTN